MSVDEQGNFSPEADQRSEDEGLLRSLWHDFIDRISESHSQDAFLKWRMRL